MVNSEIVEDDDHSFPSALVLEPKEEVLKLRCVVVLLEDERVDESSFSTDCSDYSDRMAPLLNHCKLHAWCEPALGKLHLYMNSGIVKVNYLVIAFLDDICPKLLYKLQLPLTELLILSHALPELVVGALIPDTEINIVLAKSHAVE